MKIPHRHYAVRYLQLWEPMVQGFLLHDGQSPLPSAQAVEPAPWKGAVYEAGPWSRLG